MSHDSTDVGSRFLATTLHEIRTPIQTIISTTELLEDSVMDKEQAEYVHQIEFSAGILLQLANNILDFTKIHAKEFKLEGIDDEFRVICSPMILTAIVTERLACWYEYNTGHSLEFRRYYRQFEY